MADTSSGNTPLSEEEYARVFTINDKSTDLKEKMLEVMKPIIADLGPVNLMSIGAGTGNFEDDLIKRCGLNLKKYLAVEFNEDLVMEMMKTVSKWGD